MHTKRCIYIYIYIFVCRNLYIFAVFVCERLLVFIAVGSFRRSFKTWILFLGIHWVLETLTLTNSFSVSFY
jgi:hypothetical protein